ncbi:neuronal acetylcholine receptor subunit alpha-6-like [Argopecten irradians]|uniref:neuronal acetylcholine receptor subunit alpha-6-like n=1 Tax=Argopecten irradians TaxID=31199 RepID=UPI00371EEB3E
MNDLMKLERDLFRSYNKNLRPAYNLSDAVLLDTSLSIMAILDFNEVSGTLQLSTFVRISWTDFRLCWNASEYGGISNYVSNASLVWKPRIFLISSADDIIQFGDDKFDIRIWSTGVVNFNPAVLIKSSCDVDMTYFPTDSHICRVTIVPWMYTIEEVKFNFLESKIHLDYFIPNGAWGIYDAFINDDVDIASEVSIMDFTLYLQRKPQYHILSLLIPILLLCFLNPFVFLLPAASGERISFAVTMFLSMTVYMSSIGEVMPKVSDPIAGASYFLLGAMSFSCLLILLTIASLCLHTVLDINDFPAWLLQIASCSKTLRNVNRTDTNTVVEHMDSDSEIVIKKEMQKNNITKIIDRFIFCITEIMVSKLWFH